MSYVSLKHPDSALLPDFADLLERARQAVLQSRKLLAQSRASDAPGEEAAECTPAEEPAGCASQACAGGA
jgi:hypothetical protein